MYIWDLKIQFSFLRNRNIYYSRPRLVDKRQDEVEVHNRKKKRLRGLFYNAHKKGWLKYGFRSEIYVVNYMKDTYNGHMTYSRNSLTEIKIHFYSIFYEFEAINIWSQIDFTDLHGVYNVCRNYLKYYAENFTKTVTANLLLRLWRFTRVALLVILTLLAKWIYIHNITYKMPRAFRKIFIMYQQWKQKGDDNVKTYYSRRLSFLTYMANVNFFIIILGLIIL